MIAANGRAPAGYPPAQRAIFVVTILTGSFLLFLIQPMVARMALPRLGGAPNVWNSAMLVYQALLLAGYAYAHRHFGQMPFRRQAVKIHLRAAAWCLQSLCQSTLYRSAISWNRAGKCCGFRCCWSR